jgi:hypothetical protein
MFQCRVCSLCFVCKLEYIFFGLGTFLVLRLSSIMCISLDSHILFMNIKGPSTYDSVIYEVNN